ncbi:FxSxx-COOH system tetratricopeptide repeat protein [Streptomyces sp. NPDC016566]|uniref:FxSxx-COOH system tetratricopeptide repeat protein n=1 Tax=Streptomyces sp. NPDC016566 TaxID=3364967 RepID=UPI0036F6219D
MKNPAKHTLDYGPRAPQARTRRTPRAPRDLRPRRRHPPPFSPPHPPPPLRLCLRVHDKEASVSAGLPVTPGPRGPHGPPRTWGNVPQRNWNFTGREALLERLQERLRSGVTAVLPEALHGMGGVGKSQIAIEYVYRHSREHRLIWWIPSEQENQIVQSLIELGKQMGLQVGSEMSAVPAVLDVLRQGEPYRNWLLVFDNAENPKVVRKYFPNDGPGRIVVTFRNSQWSTDLSSLEADVFAREESVALLRRRNPQLPDEAVDHLASALGDLPLAVEQAAVWLAETGMPVQQYLEVYECNFTEIMHSDPPGDDNQPVAAAWNISLGRLCETRPDTSGRLTTKLQRAEEEAAFALVTDAFVVDHKGDFTDVQRDNRTRHYGLSHPDAGSWMAFRSRSRVAGSRSTRSPTSTPTACSPTRHPVMAVLSAPSGSMQSARYRGGELNAALRAGAPIVVRDRRGGVDPAFRNELQELAWVKGIHRLPDEVRSLRIAPEGRDAAGDGSSTLGRHAALIWDDPYRLPLRQREVRIHPRRDKGRTRCIDTTPASVRCCRLPRPGVVSPADPRWRHPRRTRRKSSAGWAGSARYPPVPTRSGARPTWPTRPSSCVARCWSRGAREPASLPSPTGSAES